MDDAASDAAASDALPADTLAAPAPDFDFDQRLAWSSGLRARRHGAAGLRPLAVKSDSTVRKTIMRGSTSLSEILN